MDWVRIYALVFLGFPLFIAQAVAADLAWFRFISVDPTNETAYFLSPKLALDADANVYFAIGAPFARFDTSPLHGPQEFRWSAIAKYRPDSTLEWVSPSPTYLANGYTGFSILPDGRTLYCGQLLNPGYPSPTYTDVHGFIDANGDNAGQFVGSDSRCSPRPTIVEASNIVAHAGLPNLSSTSLVKDSSGSYYGSGTLDLKGGFAGFQLFERTYICKLSPEGNTTWILPLSAGEAPLLLATADNLYFAGLVSSYDKRVRSVQIAGREYPLPLAPSAYLAQVDLNAPTPPPLVQSEPIDKTLTAGEPLRLEAFCSGFGPLLYQWMRDGKPVFAGTNRVFEIPETAVSDGGEYTFSVSNGGGTVLSSPARIKIDDARLIKKQPLHQTVPSGATALFSIEVTNVLSLQWFKDFRPLAGATNSMLVVSNVTAGYVGSYFAAVNGGSRAEVSAIAVLDLLTNLVEPQVTFQKSPKLLLWKLVYNPNDENFYSYGQPRFNGDPAHLMRIDASGNLLQRELSYSNAAVSEVRPGEVSLGAWFYRTGLVDGIPIPPGLEVVAKIGSDLKLELPTTYVVPRFGRQYRGTELGADRYVYRGDPGIEVATGNGQQIWSQSWPERNYWAPEFEARINGDIYIHIRKDGTNYDSFLGGSLPGEYFALLDSMGNRRWVKRLDAPSNGYGGPVTAKIVSTDGSLFVSGTCPWGEVTWGGQTILKAEREKETYFLKIDREGCVEWVNHIPGYIDMFFHIFGVASDVKGNSYWVTEAATPVQIGNIRLSPDPPGSNTVYVVMLDRAGQARWGKSLRVPHPSQWEPLPSIFCNPNGRTLIVLFNEFFPERGPEDTIVGLRNDPPDLPIFEPLRLHVDEKFSALLLVSWNFRSGNAVLESTTNLGEPFETERVPVSADFKNAQFKTAIPNSFHRNKFFRLRRINN